MTGGTLNAVISISGRSVVARGTQAIAALARAQVECGAQMPNVNASEWAGGDEVADSTWMMDVAPEAAGIPLVLDTTNAEALPMAINACRGQRPSVSSTSAEPERLIACCRGLWSGVAG